MLLSRDAIAVVVEQVTAEDFYKPSHAHIYDANHLAVRPRASPPTRSPFPRSFADSACSDASAARPRSSRCRPIRRRSRAPAATPRIVEEHAPAPPADRSRPRDRRDRLRAPGRRRRGTRPGRGHGLRGRTTAQLRQRALVEGPPQRESRTSRAPLRPGRDHHRRPNRLQRARPPALGPPAVQPGRRRRPALDGQDCVRARAGRRTQRPITESPSCSSRSR